MKLFDTHFHLPESGEGSFADFDAAVAGHLIQSHKQLILPDNSIELAMVAAGGNYNGSRLAGEYAHCHDNCYYSCGVHPHDAAEYLQSKPDFSGFRNDPKLVAIGEIGLDYFYEESSIAEQIEVFEYFLALALEWNLPAMLHIRDKEGAFDAGNAAFERLDKFAGAGGRFVIHCCTIPEDKISPFIDLGAMIGVTGMITFKRAENLREMLKKVPLDRLMLETDSPYLAPVPFRGKVNTPGLLVLAAQALAIEKGVSLEEICEITTANTEKFYINNPR